MLSSIRNAIKVINIFSTAQSELGIKEIATHLNKPTSSTHHIIKTLAEEGILVRTESRKYRLGSQLLHWGEVVKKQYEPYFLATPYVESLAKSINEIVYLAILENKEVCILMKALPLKPLRIETTTGSRVPIHCTAMGKVLLAYQPQKFIENVIAQNLQRYTPKTMTTAEKLRRELKKVHEFGYAVNDEEYEQGLYDIAVPVFDFMNHVSIVLSVWGPEVRLKEKKMQTIKQSKMTADKIAKQLDL